MGVLGFYTIATFPPNTVPDSHERRANSFRWVVGESPNARIGITQNQSTIHNGFHTVGKRVE